MTLRVQSRYSLAILGLIALVVVSLSASLLTGFRATEQETREASLRAMSDGLMTQLEEEATNLAELLATTLAKPLYFFDLDVIAGVLESAVALESVVFVHLEDVEGRIVHDGSVDISDYGNQIDEGHLDGGRHTTSSVSWVTDGAYHVVTPVNIGSQIIGYLHLGVSMEHHAGGTGLPGAGSGPGRRAGGASNHQHFGDRVPRPGGAGDGHGHLRRAQPQPADPGIVAAHPAHRRRRLWGGDRAAAQR